MSRTPNEEVLERIRVEFAHKGVTLKPWPPSPDSVNVDTFDLVLEAELNEPAEAVALQPVFLLLQQFGYPIKVRVVLDTDQGEPSETGGSEPPRPSADVADE